MSEINSSAAAASLPDRPDLRHLREEARDLVRAGEAPTQAKALFAVAKRYGYASWPRLKAEIESRQATGMLKDAIDSEDWPRVREMMTANPELHRAPIGYNKNGPLTWLAECRVPWQPPTSERLEMARWMLTNGSDIHQGGDGPLMRAALNDDRIPMMDLLVAHGADVNAHWNGNYPILLAPCETLAARSLARLLECGADPTAISAKYGNPLGMLIGTYSRSAEGKQACLGVLAERGFALPDTAPMALHLGSTDLLEEHLHRDPKVLSRRYSVEDVFPRSLGLDPEKTFAWTPIDGVTLLHLAVEFDDVATVAWLIDHGADVNAGTAAETDGDGFGGHTPLFHSVIFGRGTDDTARLLLQAGADPNVRASLRRWFSNTDDSEVDRAHEFEDVTALGYARSYPEQQWINQKAVEYLLSMGAVE